MRPDEAPGGIEEGAPGRRRFRRNEDRGDDEDRGVRIHRVGEVTDEARLVAVGPVVGEGIVGHHARYELPEERPGQEPSPKSEKRMSPGGAHE